MQDAGFFYEAGIYVDQHPITENVIAQKAAFVAGV